jgi:hypothetical protein
MAEMKLSSCGLEVADIRKNGIAELRLRRSISLKSCGIAIAEVLPSSCGIAISDSKKSCACPPLVISLCAWTSAVTQSACCGTQCCVGSFNFFSQYIFHTTDPFLPYSPRMLYEWGRAATFLLSCFSPPQPAV